MRARFIGDCDGNLILQVMRLRYFESCGNWYSEEVGWENARVEDVVEFNIEDILPSKN
jgi:UDP-glucose 4-epimerase